MPDTSVVKLRVDGGGGEGVGDSIHDRSFGRLLVLDVCYRWFWTIEKETIGCWSVLLKK